MYKITLVESKESFPCKDGEHVLGAMVRLGRKGIPSGCRGGACGVCKVKVHHGYYLQRPMSRCHISVEDLENQVVLACRIFPTADIHIEVLGKMKNNVLYGKPKNQTRSESQ